MRKIHIFSLGLLCLVSCVLAEDLPLVIPEVSVGPDQPIESSSQENVQTTQITRKTVVESTNTNLADLLKQEQSIVRVLNNTNDNSLPVFSIRGFGDNAFANTLITIDGFPLSNPSILAPNFNAVVLSDIQKIEIVQGSQGSLWGDQAVGGLMNITTRHPEKWMADATVGYGSFNKQFYSILLGNKWENGLFFKLNGYLNNTDNYRDSNKQTDQVGNLQLGRDYSSGTLSLTAKLFDDRIDLPGGLTKQQYDSNPRQATTPGNFNHYTTTILQLLNKQEIHPDWIIETRASYNNIDGDGFINSTYTRNDETASLNPVIIGKIFNSQIRLGYEGIGNHFQINSGNTAQQADAVENDLYGRLIVPFLSRFDATLGARKAWQNNNLVKATSQDMHALNQVFVTEQGLAFHASEQWDFFVRRDGNFRMPKANEQTTLPAAISSLQPQTGVSYESGIQWQAPRNKLQLSLYRLDLNNEIAFNPTQTSAAPFGSFSNFPKTQRNGVTLTEKFIMFSNFTVNGQLNYVDARFVSGTNDGNFIPAVPAINGNIGADYQFIKHWHIKYAAIYNGSAFASQDVANVGQKVPAYWLHDAGLEYGRKKFNIGCEVENLFNQRYSAYTVYSPSTQAETFYPGVGRNFLLTAKMFL